MIGSKLIENPFALLISGDVIHFQHPSGTGIFCPNGAYIGYDEPK